MNFEKLENYISALPKKGIPACDIMVYKDHNLLFRSMSGYSDIQKTKKVSERDLYNIFSNTKLYTVVAAMQLVEQEKLSLDDDASNYIPSFKNLTYKTRNGLEKADPITVYQLLTMTSGLSYAPYPIVEEFCKKSGEKASTLEIISEFANEPLEFNSGTRWKYGRSHDVLGAIIEVVTGIKFSEYLKKNIWEPLGIKNTTFDLTSENVKEHLSAFYVSKGDLISPQPSDNFKYDFAKYCRNFEGGGGGLISTTEDYAILVDALANGGIGKTGNRILKSETIDLIKQPQLDLLKQSQFIISHYKCGYSYGLGVRTLIDKGYGARTPLGEFAWDGATGGYGLVDTDNHIAICYMQNVLNSSYAWHTIFPETRDMIYEILGIE